MRFVATLSGAHAREMEVGRRVERDFFDRRTAWRRSAPDFSVSGRTGARQGSAATSRERRELAGRQG